jgi:hypothetical protein
LLVEARASTFHADAVLAASTITVVAHGELVGQGLGLLLHDDRLLDNNLGLRRHHVDWWGCLPGLLGVLVHWLHLLLLHRLLLLLLLGRCGSRGLIFLSDLMRFPVTGDMKLTDLSILEHDRPPIINTFVGA